MILPQGIAAIPALSLQSHHGGRGLPGKPVRQGTHILAQLANLSVKERRPGGGSLSYSRAVLVFDMSQPRLVEKNNYSEKAAKK